ncbi:PROTEIN putative-RELATED [Salix koriyanagi]|uniref:PROTEIN putative-RELATED n=1 Tax=Salix koriyanagi TaxID=2511006 RepID=A0A9Q0ZBD6_9ROSI|nr:PROTEIN putative-RELATED [Salix koriyanagi]
MGFGVSLQKPASKRDPGPPASSPTSASASASPAPFPQTMPLEMRTFGWNRFFDESCNTATDQEKLELAVQIIRKRNPGLFQQEDEIEVDIDSFDDETLWELHSHVNNYQKSISRNDGEARVVLQDRKEADHNMLGTKFTSATAEAPKDLGSGNNHLEFPRILCCLHSGFSFVGSLWHSNHYAY